MPVASRMPRWWHGMRWLALRGLLVGALVAGCSGSACAPAPSEPPLRLGTQEVRVVAGPGLSLVVGRGGDAWPLQIVDATGPTERALPSTFLRQGNSLIARGPLTFREPTLVRATIAGERLSIADSGGARLGLRVPEAAVVIAEGKPAIAVGDTAAPCLLLRGTRAMRVDAGHVRLDGDGATITGESIQIGIDEAKGAVRAAIRLAGLEPVEHAGSVGPRVAGIGVVAIGALGEPLGAGVTQADGSFDIVARPGSARLFALLGEGRGSDVVPSALGVRLPLLSLGHLRVVVRDEASGRALPSRVFVHGIAGTREPNFGPAFRASGNGSIIDVEDGRLDTPLPVGRYRVVATHGPEWTLGEQEIEIRPGAHAAITLALRHVVPTPGLAACDFHVHSAVGFDSDVGVEDRVRTLAGVGIDFAIPSEHNRIGSYVAAERLGLGADFGWTQGVEVTTHAPLEGHFNVFPYTLPEPPPSQRTNLSQLVGLVRREIPDAIIQVNHPRLGSGMGYFDQIGLDPRTHVSRRPAEEGFDTLEVYNGFDLPRRARVEALLGEWLGLFDAGRRHWATGNSDSHAAQYLWAGFPRTYVAVAGDHEDFFGPPVAAADVVSALKRGHATVTSGPLIDLSAGETGEATPGDVLMIGPDQDVVRVHVKVRAAPWVDVRSVSVLVRGKEVERWTLPERELPGPGAIDRAREARDVVRLDRVARVPVPAGGGSLVVIARGDRSFSDVLPFLEGAPYAFTNPVRLVR